MKNATTDWDWPLRLFHWLLVLSVIGSYVTGNLGGDLTDWHERLGGFILGLLVFRLAWGLVGSSTARFSQFVPRILQINRYLRGEWQGAGHNPLGVLAVIALLITLLLIAVTGLFANDDVTMEGPFYLLIDKEFSDKITGWHTLAFNVLLGLIALHLSAIACYRIKKNINLVKPMLFGRQQLADTRPFKLSGLIFSIAIASGSVWSIWHYS